MSDIVYERWAPIPDYAGLYEVSDQGRVRSVRKNLILTPKPTGDYWGVSLARGGRKIRRYLHELVLTTFVAPRPPGHESAHDDGVRSNNVLANLAWKTRSGNHLDKRQHGTDHAGERNPAAKLTRAEAMEIRAAKGVLRPLARKHRVSVKTIQHIQQEVTWRR